MRATLTEAQRHASGLGMTTEPDPLAEMIRRIEPLVSLTLYLCSTGADIRRSDGGSDTLARHQPKTTKKNKTLTA